MRVFFALELDPATAVQVADWRERQFSFAASPPGGRDSAGRTSAGRTSAGRSSAGRPVPPANFHITLAFVGDLREPSLEQLCGAVDNWLEASDPAPSGSSIRLDTIGYWPKPGIYWLGPDSWPDQLTELAGKLRGLATSAGGKRDRNRFQPHVTLFRGCSGAPPPPVEPPDFTLAYSHFTLFESRQGRKGVSYHPLQDWRLEGRRF